jgi:LmbE family N-acetylglucosaminyl deacetylase
VLTIYDDHGGYGHPDHIQVHRVGGRAGDLAGTPRLFEATMNRDHLRRMVQFARDTGLEIADLPSPESFDGLGSPESDITTAVDIEDYVDVKRSAMAAHASQIGETSLFLSLPDDAFRAVWGTEWFIARHASPHRTDLFGEFERAAQ